MKILIAGATGFLGQAIVQKALQHSFDVAYLTTQKKKIKHNKNYNGFYWNPKKNEIDILCFKNVDAVINLSGAAIFSKWTKNGKKKILESRILSTRLLKTGIKRAKNHSVKSFVSASAIGIYPHHPKKSYDEKAQLSPKRFLEKLTFQWEKEAQQCATTTICVTIFRIGLVLSSKGGFLPKILFFARKRLGIVFGNGQQWQSWIHIEDLTSLFFKAILENWQGIYNAVAPYPITQKKMIKSIQQNTKSPFFIFYMPAFLLKIILGERSQLLLNSQKVIPKSVQKKEFPFAFPEWDDALNFFF